MRTEYDFSNGVRGKYYTRRKNMFDEIDVLVSARKSLDSSGSSDIAVSCLVNYLIKKEERWLKNRNDVISRKLETLSNETPSHLVANLMTEKDEIIRRLDELSNLN